MEKEHIFQMICPNGFSIEFDSFILLCIFGLIGLAGIILFIITLSVYIIEYHKKEAERLEKRRAKENHESH